MSDFDLPRRSRFNFIKGRLCDPKTSWGKHAKSRQFDRRVGRAAKYAGFQERVDALAKKHSDLMWKTIREHLGPLLKHRQLTEVESPK